MNLLKKEKIIIIANAYLPTLQLSFIKPLASLVKSGAIDIEVLTELQMREVSHKSDEEVHGWILDRLNKFEPTIVIFCRYNGPHAAFMREWMGRNSIPVIYHIDDDLLSIPSDIGDKKFIYHNDPKRLDTVRYLLDSASLIYASTIRLSERLSLLGIESAMYTGKIYCSGEIIVPAEPKPVQRFGYMASADHAHNLNMILPAIVQFMRHNSSIIFELFGSIQKPPELEEFADRIVLRSPIQNYDEFLKEFSSFEWDIGICPLTKIDFNLMKANTKWVEYTSVGIAVIASKGTVYDNCCEDGCGILAETQEDWFEALVTLSSNQTKRYQQVERAQTRLKNEYSIDRLRKQVLDVIAQARLNA